MMIMWIPTYWSFFIFLLFVSALIYVVDSSNKDRIKESYNELAKLLQEKELKDASLLIFANKQVKYILFIL